MVAVPVILVGLAVALFLVLARDDSPQARKKRPEPPPPPFEFTEGETEFVSTSGKAKNVDDAAREEAQTAITEVMNAVYDGGFVTTSRWADGTFPDVMEQFGSGSASRAQEDLAELTLGPESARLAKVVPGDNRLDLSVLFGKEEAVGAVAHASFEGLADLKSGGKIAITHGGVFFLRPEEGAWRIYGWKVTGSLDTPEPAPGPTPTEAAA